MVGGERPASAQRTNTPNTATAATRAPVAPCAALVQLRDDLARGAYTYAREQKKLDAKRHKKRSARARMATNLRALGACWVVCLVLVALVARGATAKLVRSVVLVRNSEWGTGSDGKAQRDVLGLAEAEAAHMLGKRLRNVYVRSHRLIQGAFDPAHVRMRAQKTTRSMQLAVALTTGLFEVERGRAVQAEPVPVEAIAEDELYCLAAHPVMLELPAALESTMEHLHFLVKIDRDLDAFDLDLVTEPLLAAPRFPAAVPLDFIDSLQRLAKWARDSKYGDPHAAQLQGGRVAFELLAGALVDDAGPLLSVMVVNEYGFYTFLDTLVAKASSAPARLVALELHVVGGRQFLHVLRDFAPLSLDACEDCELAVIRAALKAKSAFVGDAEWAEACHAKPAAAAAATEAAAVSAGPTSTSAASDAAAAALDAEGAVPVERLLAAAAAAAAATPKKECESNVFDFTRGLIGGLVCASLLFLLYNPRAAARANARLPVALPDPEAQWRKDAQPSFIIPRPVRQRVGSSG